MPAQSSRPAKSAKAVASPVTLAPEAREALTAAMAALELASKALAAVAAQPAAQQAKPKTAPKTAPAAAKPTRAERKAANVAAYAAEKAARPLNEPNGPATASQLWFLHLLLGVDTRTPKYAKLTKAQAAAQITAVKAGKTAKAGSRSA